MFGACGEISTKQEDAFRQVPEFCRKCDEELLTDEINTLLGRFHDTMLHSALYDYTETSFKYLIGYYLPKGLKVPDKFTKLSVPALTWAVFPAPNPDIQALWRRIWSEWFPTSGYEQVEGPQFEMYYGMAKHEHAIGEIWIPVRKK